jgi:hypothetical protein
MSKHQGRCPTRLVSISGSTAKLVYPPAGSSFPYAALSHCWGSGQPLKTIKQNVRNHMTAIPLNQLPPTFRDAITVAQELGLAYIWIDSLCIVQDDSADWEKEAANMANIYESAEVTIAAAWGSDGSAGCFHDHVLPVLVEVSGGTNYLHEQNQECVRLAIRPLLDQRLFVTQAPLNTRKWVLQERILSPRTLTFAQDQMHWACPSLNDSEDGLAQAEFSTENSNYKSLHYWESGAGEDINKYLQLHESWELVVADHSSRKLTFARDKLATLAGVSQAFQRIFGDEPLLGLWRDDLARTLLWEAETAVHSQLDGEAIRTLNLPSWSWLKIDGTARAVSHYGHGSLLSIQGTVLTWTGLPMTSEVSEAKILGRGKIFPIVEVGQPAGETCMCYANRLRLQSARDTTEELAVYTWSLDQCVEKLSHEISCLFVYDSKVSTRWTLPDDPSVEACCLILGRPVNARSTLEYVRLGVVMIKDVSRELLGTVEDQDFVLV